MVLDLSVSTAPRPALLNEKEAMLKASHVYRMGRDRNGSCLKWAMYGQVVQSYFGKFCVI